MPSSVHPVRCEMGEFDMLTVGEMSTELKPKEIIRSEAQEALELQAVTARQRHSSTDISTGIPKTR